jgi:hypothetical protein
MISRTFSQNQTISRHVPIGDSHSHHHHQLTLNAAPLQYNSYGTPQLQPYSESLLTVFCADKHCEVDPTARAQWDRQFLYIAMF